MSQSPQAQRARVPEHGGYWVPLTCRRIWSNPLWEIFGSYTFVDVDGEPALKAEPGHDRAPGVFAFIAATFGYVAMLAWVFLGVHNPLDSSTPPAGYVPWLLFGGTLIFGALATWNIFTQVYGRPSTALVLLTSPKVVAFARQESHPETGKLSNADGRSVLEAQLRPPRPREDPWA